MTEEEEKEVETIFNFPLFKSAHHNFIAAHSKGSERTLMIIYKPIHDNQKLFSMIIHILNGEDVKLKLKNIKFEFKQSSLYMNDVLIMKENINPYLITEHNFDFIKKERISRLFKEYVVEKLTKAFNKSEQ